MAPPIRFRFGPFVLSPRGRTLSRDGRSVPLIPKYFDVLHLLVVRRADAVAKGEIFAAVWSDVIVTDGALAQAIRTLRRALDDDPKAPRFIRTVSRHGYQFIAAGVVEEPDSPDAGPAACRPRPRPGARPADLDEAVERLITAANAGAAADAEAREAAGRLLALGDEAVGAVRAHPAHARALAHLREARWDSVAEVEVPLAGDAELTGTALALVGLRLRDGAALVRSRASGAAGDRRADRRRRRRRRRSRPDGRPGATATPLSALALAILGAVAGATGTAAVALGVAAAELVARSRRGPAVVAAATLSGAVAGGAGPSGCAGAVTGVARRRDAGHRRPGEGALVAAAVAAAYALTTGWAGGGRLPAPTGARRAAVLAAAAAGGALAGAALGALDRPLVGGLMNQIARQSDGAALTLGPLGRFLGEATFGPVTRLLLAAFEGAAFGLAVGLSLTRRPSLAADLIQRSRAAHGG